MYCHNLNSKVIYIERNDQIKRDCLECSDSCTELLCSLKKQTLNHESNNGSAFSPFLLRLA